MIPVRISKDPPARNFFPRDPKIDVGAESCKSHGFYKRLLFKQFS